MKLLISYVLSWALLSLAHAATKQFSLAKDSYPFVVKITQEDLPLHQAIDYYLMRDSLVVVLRQTPAPSDNPPHIELFSRRLTKSEQELWARYLREFPLKELNSEYINHRVNDGLRVYFTFKTGSGERRIAVENVDVPKLMELFAQIGKLLPEDIWKRGGVPDGFLFDK